MPKTLSQLPLQTLRTLPLTEKDTMCTEQRALRSRGMAHSPVLCHVMCCALCICVCVSLCVCVCVCVFVVFGGGLCVTQQQRISASNLGWYKLNGFIKRGVFRELNYYFPKLNCTLSGMKYLFFPKNCYSKQSSINLHIQLKWFEMVSRDV